MTHGFVLGDSEDDSSKLVPLFMMENRFPTYVCYVEFWVHVLEYIVGAAVVGFLRSIAAIVPVVMMGSI